MQSIHFPTLLAIPSIFALPLSAYNSLSYESKQIPAEHLRNRNNSLSSKRGPLDEDAY